jgi:O-methyltransferase
MSRMLRARQEERQTQRLVERARRYSMVYEPTLEDLAHRVREVVGEKIPGDLVECGVWRGGSAFLMAETLDRLGDEGRKVWLFDSFEGLPPPKEVDGPGAARYAADTESPWYHDNCRAGLEEVRANAREFGVAHRTEMVPGWFEESLPANRGRVGPIALLRLDCDWYESVMTCLESLYDQVSPGGTVIVDDYYVWDGCAVAVHEFLGRRGLAHRLHEAAGVAFFRKG